MHEHSEDSPRRRSLYDSPRADPHLDSETTIDWNSHGDQRTTVPLDFLVSRLRLGILPVSVQLGGGIFLNTPRGGPDWRLRVAFTVVVPQRE
jgi:hypothetical protein